MNTIILCDNTAVIGATARRSARPSIISIATSIFAGTQFPVYTIAIQPCGPSLQMCRSALLFARLLSRTCGFDTSGAGLVEDDAQHHTVNEHDMY